MRNPENEILTREEKAEQYALNFALNFRLVKYQKVCYLVNRAAFVHERHLGRSPDYFHDSKQITGTRQAVVKFIGEEDARKIKEVIRMTKVERLYEEEKQEAVKKAVKEAVKEAVDENTGRIAINMLRGGDSEEKVSSCTGLSPEVVKQLALEAV